MPTITYTQIADEIKARIYEIAQGKIASYTFANRTFNYLNIKDLAELEQTFRQLGYEETNQYGCVTLADVRTNG